MDWDTPYTVSQSLFLQISREGKFLASSSLSRKPQVLGEEAVPLLLAFAAGVTPREAFASLVEEWEVEEEGFTLVVEGLIAQNFLTPRGETAPTLAAGGFASVHVHHHMLRDAVRVFSYRSAIFRQCPGKRVAEIGCGTGILSIFAAQAGAERVEAIEESRIAEVATRMFAQNGVADRVLLKLGNSRDIELAEPADVVIHEILGNDPFGESLLSVLANARRFLAPEGRFLPYRLEVACRGIDLGQDPAVDRQKMVAEARELAGLYGVDFTPFLEALDATPQGSLPRSWRSDEGGFKPPVLTEELILCDLDLQRDDLESPPFLENPRLQVRAAGTLSGVVLYFRAHLDESICLTNSPLSLATHWGWDVRPLARAVPVEPGGEVPLTIELRNWLGRQSLGIDLADSVAEPPSR